LNIQLGEDFCSLPFSEKAAEIICQIQMQKEQLDNKSKTKV